MKKNIEYLQSVIQRRIDNLPSTYECLYIEGSRDAYELVLQDIDQLDEPEVLPQGWVDEYERINNNRIYTSSDGVTGEYIHTDKLETLTVPEVLSQEWIEEHTYYEDEYDFYYADPDELKNLLVPKHEELESKIKVLIEAYKQEDGAYSNPENGWISGFVEDLENLVEEEQKYYVLFPLRDDHEYMTLKKDGRIVYTQSKKLLETFTEQEIKDYDKRYWAFAEPVEE